VNGTTEADLDKTRRYLRPVRATIISDDPYGVHLAVYSWLELGFDAWVTGPGICGESTMQGPLPEGTAVTCAGCLERQADYERYLAPGYLPEDDNPKILRQRLEEAEASLVRVLAFAAEIDDRTWRAPGTEVALRIRSVVSGERTEGGR
jgi:hypothetical protein